MDEETRLLFDRVLPLYKLLHAYVRYKLREFHGPDLVPENGPLPAHLLGNEKTKHSFFTNSNDWYSFPLLEITRLPVKPYAISSSDAL